MSLVSSLNIAQQALSVNQSAITVISNNIANVDNKNYSKLTVQLREVVNYTPSAGNPLSVAESLSGVEMLNVARASDTYLQKYYWEENATYNYFKQYSSIASNVENVMNELNGTGLSEALTTFYEAVDALSDDATDITARQNFVSAAENVCYIFNNISGDVTNLQNSLVGEYTDPGSVQPSEIADQLDDFNNLLDQLASVNNSIIKTNSNTSSSSALLDQRDSIISSLTSFMPVTVKENNNGTVNLSVGNYELLKGTNVLGHFSVETGTATQPAVINIVDPNDPTSVEFSNVNSAIDSGSIGAILEACGTSNTDLTINGVMKDLNTLASTFAAIMNNIQNGDPDGDGSVAMCLTGDGTQLQKATENLFTSSSASSTTTTIGPRAREAGDVAGTVISTSLDAAGNATTSTVTTLIDNTTNQTTITTTTTTGISAKNINLNSDISDNSYLIAAGRLTKDEYAEFVATGKYKDSVGDNTNATLMMNTRAKTYSGLGDLSLENYLSSTVSSIGYQVDNIDSNLENQGLVLNEIETKLTAATGVNLDEELVDLIKYQRAYQAAARVFSVCNELLESLISLGS